MAKTSKLAVTTSAGWTDAAWLERPSIDRLIVFHENVAATHSGISIGVGIGTDVFLEDNNVASAALPNADPSGALAGTQLVGGFS